jgi:hypothetical protein
MDYISSLEFYLKTYLDNLKNQIGNSTDTSISKDLKNLSDSIKAKNGGV